MCLLALPALAQEDKGESAAGAPAALFEKQCYSCHNIGGGDKTGPDLIDLTTRRSREWLRRFIVAPKATKSAGDATAQELFSKYAPEVMPDQTLAAEQLDQILDMIETLSGQKTVFIPKSGKLSRRPTAPDIPAGRKLFTGQQELTRGGPACISCHSAPGIGYLAGGTLGPNLTNANLKYTEVELASILKAPGFPVMSRVFAEHELSDEEVVQLFAFLRSVRGAVADEPAAAARYLVLSATGMVMLFCLTALVWRGRLRDASRGLRSSNR